MKTLILTLIMTLVFGTILQAKTTKDEEIKLLVNRQKTVTKDKLTLKFISVLEDSRCPEDVNCVWAGNAKVQIKLRSRRGISKTFELNTGLEPKTVTSYASAVLLKFKILNSLISRREPFGFEFAFRVPNKQ